MFCPDLVATVGLWSVVFVGVHDTRICFGSWLSVSQNQHRIMQVRSQRWTMTTLSNCRYVECRCVFARSDHNMRFGRWYCVSLNACCCCTYGAVPNHCCCSVLFCSHPIMFVLVSCIGFPLAFSESVPLTNKTISVECCRCTIQ